MMKKTIKLAVVGLMSLLLANCAGNSYKIKNEQGGKILNKVPSWYMADFDEKKACDLSMWTKKDNEKVCIFGVGTAVSPDLNLAIEKAKMIAKAEIADIIKGEMNKESKQFITELGKTHTKTIVTEVESVLINKIEHTIVRGYEIFEQDVTLTKQKYYRAWVGLRLPLGEFNKMYYYAFEEAVDAFKLKESAKTAFDNLIKENESESTNN